VKRTTPESHEAISTADLPSFFTGAERVDLSTHLVGTELEKFGAAIGSASEPPRPVTYRDHVLPVLQALMSEFGWEPGPNRGEAGELVELRRNGASITLEPGGQLELSGAPKRNVHETCAEFTEHYEELHAVSQPLQLAWFSAGHHPWATREEISWMPKGRYRVMGAYLPTRGKLALDMMLRTCTVQANFDFASEAQCGVRLRLLSAVAPIVSAMFANSPYVEGRSTGYQSWRNHVWTDMDPVRCGVRPFFFENFSYARYTDWALDVPMFFVKREGHYFPHHATFRTYLEDGFVDPTGRAHRATWEDWTTHLSTLFPEVRLKPYLEFRSADAVGSRFVCALPALLKGLLYDEDAGGEAWELFKPGSFDDRVALYDEAARIGLASPRIREWAGRLLGLARAGLDRHDVRDRKGRSESRFLDRLEPMIEQGRSPGDEVLESLGANPGRSPQALRAFVQAFHFAGATP